MKKINFFDGLLVLVIAIFIVLLVIVYLKPPKNLGEPASITVEVIQNADLVYEEAAKMGTVYLNGQKQASKITDIEKDNERILIIIEGLGTKEDEVYIFNGQRVLVGQKAELHGGFWAQGYITEINIK
jgi:hypothetical protein